MKPSLLSSAVCPAGGGTAGRAAGTGPWVAPARPGAPRPPGEAGKGLGGLEKAGERKQGGVRKKGGSKLGRSFSNRRGRQPDFPPPATGTSSEAARLLFLACRDLHKTIHSSSSDPGDFGELPQNGMKKIPNLSLNSHISSCIASQTMTAWEDFGVV